MRQIKTAIIPVKQEFVKVPNTPHEIDYKAICVFSALGFFLDTDTYWKDIKVLRPGTINDIDNKGYLLNSETWFNWHYTPREISFDTALSEFTALFETIISDQVKDKNIILPISGGLDSRCQAVAINKLPNQVFSYSYEFKNGYSETKIAKTIAQYCQFNFKAFNVGEGYLWNTIDELAKINACYSEFTHPRQMAIISDLKDVEGVFSLGHWGDVLFDSDDLSNISSDELLALVLKKIVKKGGYELAEKLWELWDINGDFKLYLKSRIQQLLGAIEISHVGAKIRAFKSLYWAPRWTSVNLAIFGQNHDLTLPFYDDRMCQFICTVPEQYLANRQLQIAYITQQNLKIAKVTWQSQKPFNLLNFNYNKSPYNLPYRLVNKFYRSSFKIIKKKFIQRNWELQFLGETNNNQLGAYLFNESFNTFIDQYTVQHFLDKFKSNQAVYYSHAVSMLLTLSLWNKHHLNEGKG